MDVTRTYLEMTRPDALVAASPASADARVLRLEACPPELYRYLYAEVGREWHWVDRLGWDDATIRDHLAQPTLLLFVLRVLGEVAGWFELKGHDDGSTEIAYFGILPAFRRRGLGKHLLTEAVNGAWATGANRIWLHTCTLDDPAALPNYRARGFKPYKEETYAVDL